MIVHSYHVPKLDYTGEDIQIQADLVVMHGGVPALAGAMCATTEFEDCKREITPELVTSRNSYMTKGKNTGQLIKLILDHNET